jgi:alpha-glucosidase
LFNFLECNWNARCFSKVIGSWEQALEGDRWPSYVLNNHDVKRSTSRYSQGEDDERLKVAAALLLTLRGTPFIYYGEEIGMREVVLKRSQILDPVGLRFWPFYKGRDGCRTPMQWNSKTNAGFSAGQPWLPLHSNWQERNVEKQAKDSGSLLNFYKELIALRKSEEVLVRGSVQFMQGAPKNVLAYEREYLNKKAWIFLNFSDKARGIRLPKGSIQRIFSSQRDSINEGSSNTLLPNEALIVLSTDTKN